MCISLGFYTNFLYSSARILVLVTAIFIQTAFCKNSAQYSKYITTLMKPKKAKGTAQESPLSLIRQQESRNGITRLLSFFICILFALVTL